MALDAFKSALKTVGDYDIVEKLAEGGMGTVYRGKHQQSGQTVAIKVVAAHMATNQVLLKRFENEFRAASKLDHPNIIRAVDYGTVSGRPYLVMEFVDGESVGQTLERIGKLDEADALRIIEAACEGLEAAHNQGMIHRDIKPDNIMVTRDGKVKIADLGLVKDIEGEMNLTRTGRGLGTPHFMAPEQFRNAKNADVRCDIYSLGATLYMMVTGELPFKSCGPLDAWMKKVKNDLPPPRKVNPAVSERVDAAIQRAMQSDPGKRPQNCREFIADLRGTAPPGSDPAAEVWYMVYTDDGGEKHTVKGSANTIRRQFQEGHLGDPSHIHLSRSKTGNFHHIATCPEFEDLFHESALPTTPEVSNSQPTDAELKDTAIASEVNPTPETATTNPGRSEMLQMIVLAIVAMVVGMAVFFLMKR